MKLDYRSSSEKNPTKRVSPVVIVALAALMLMILWAITVPSFNSGTRAAMAKMAAAKQDISSLHVALDQFKVDAGRYPTNQEGLGTLVTSATTRPQGVYIERVPMDPWGHPYIYSTPDGGATCVLFSLGEDGLPGTEDDVK